MVEDTEAHQQLMTRMLTRLGIETINIVSTAAEFLEVLEQKSNEYNAFIIDVYLGAGQMDGLTALKVAREKGHLQPALIVTMDTNGLNLEQCYSIGITEILDKDRLYVEDVLDSSVRNLNDRVAFEHLNTSQARLVPIIGDDIHYVPAGDILFIQFDERTCRVVTYLSEYISSVSLKTYTKLLEPSGFSLVNKPTLANIARVDRLDPLSNTLTFHHDPQNRTVDVSARRIAEVKKLIKTH